jgi:hypothetical protein
MTLAVLGAVALALLGAPHAVAAPKMTAFDPAKHGFKFGNDFKNNFIPALNVQTSGLCGGMSYAALDYYFAKQQVPQQWYRPANGTPLQKYLYSRNVSQIADNLDKWAEVGFNPGGARDSEFFNWGLQGTGGGRLQELRACIDAGKPVPIALQMAKAGNHVVIAIGYDMGRYKGDLKAYRDDLQIFVLDPNAPTQTRTLVPDLKNQVYYMKDDPTLTWRTYFVDKKYKPKTPPKIANPAYAKDGKIHELILQLDTGNDDMRGGSDNLNLTVQLTDGTTQFYPNVNRSARLLPNYTEYAQVVLTRAVPAAKIKNLVLSTTFKGGIDGDNWDMQFLRVWTISSEPSKELTYNGSFRFTGDKKRLVVPIRGSAPQAQAVVLRMVLEFSAGNNLPGGSDNLDVEIVSKDGKVQKKANVNGGAKWTAHSTHQVTVTLASPLLPANLDKIVLRTTGKAAGWKMTSFKARAVGLAPDPYKPILDKVVATAGPNTFTPKKKELTVPCQP